MRIINLNIWCATKTKELEAYLLEETKTTDVFCFQEITQSDKHELHENGFHMNAMEFLNEWLPNFQSLFMSNASEFKHDGHVFICEFGPGIYSRVPILQSGTKIIFQEKTPDGVRRERHLIWIEVLHQNKPLTIISYHGYWSPNKEDCPERIEQSNIIREFLDNLQTPFVFLGDMNFAPHTQSLAILKGNDRELVTEFAVPTTRGPDYTRSDPHADYAVISPQLKLKSFKVPVIAASDHLPLELEIED